jgi:hypothetical protein
MAVRTHSRTVEVQADNQLLAGIQKHYPSTTFTTRSGPVTAAEVGDAVHGRSAAAQAVVTARTALHAAVVAEKQEVLQTNALLHDVRQGIAATFPPPEVLSDCGLSPIKPRRPLTPEQRLVRAAKARATRLARGTMSAKKKALIKGTVPATLTVATDGSPGASPPASPPAPATTNGLTPHA